MQKSKLVPKLGTEILVVIGEYPERRRATIEDLLLFKEAAEQEGVLSDTDDAEEKEKYIRLSKWGHGVYSTR
jgi:hypothetical protein